MSGMVNRLKRAAMSDIPEPITKLYLARQWDVLAAIFLKAAQDDSNNYWDQYREHVKRIEVEFQRLAGKPAITSNAQYWRRKIAYYIHTLGSDALMSDLRTVFKTYRPKSIIYFLHNSTGKVPRWEQLYRERLEQLYEIEKAAHASTIDVLGVGSMLRSDPEWVIDARQRHATLKTTLDSRTGDSYLTAKREMERISRNLKSRGYTLE